MSIAAPDAVDGSGIPSVLARRIAVHEANLFLAMARDFHEEDGHPLDDAGAASIRDVAAGVALAPAFFLVLDGVVVGFFVLSLGYSPEHGGTDGFIDDIYIVPALRGRGLGRQAMALALEEARKCGIRVLLLEVEAGNERAYRLYMKMGFHDTNRRLLRLRLAE